MKTLALAAIAAALFTMPASAQTATSDTSIRLAQADVNVRISGDGVRVGPRRHHYRSKYYRHRADCRTVVVKERRGNTVITKRIKRC